MLHKHIFAAMMETREMHLCMYTQIQYKYKTTAQSVELSPKLRSSSFRGNHANYFEQVNTLLSMI